MNRQFISFTFLILPLLFCNPTKALNHPERKFLALFTKKKIQSSVVCYQTRQKWDPTFTLDPLNALITQHILQLPSVPKHFQGRITQNKKVKKIYEKSYNKLSRAIQKTFRAILKKISFSRIIAFVKKRPFYSKMIDAGIKALTLFSKQLVNNKFEIFLLEQGGNMMANLQNKTGAERNYAYFAFQLSSTILKSSVRSIYLGEDSEVVVNYKPFRNLLLDLFKDHYKSRLYRAHLKGRIDPKLIKFMLYEDRPLVTALIEKIPELADYVAWYDVTPS